MDPADAFYQAMDSEALLNEHAPSLVEDAREALSGDASFRVAGLITTGDSRDAPAIRELITRISGSSPPVGLMVGVVPRAVVEALLTQRVDATAWREEAWQPQQVLPIVVSTRDGHRFGFFRLDARPPQSS